MWWGGIFGVIPILNALEISVDEGCPSFPVERFRPTKMEVDANVVSGWHDCGIPGLVQGELVAGQRRIHVVHVCPVRDLQHLLEGLA